MIIVQIARNAISFSWLIIDPGPNAKFQIKMCRNEDFSAAFIRGTLAIACDWTL